MKTNTAKQHYMENPEANYPLIDKILRRYTHPNLLPDVRQHAMLLLLENQHKYDPSRGAYSTFVGMYTYNALKHVMNEFSAPVRVPVCKMDKDTGKSVSQSAAQYKGVSTNYTPSTLNDKDNPESLDEWYFSLVGDLAESPEREVDLKSTVEKICQEIIAAPVARRYKQEGLFFQSNDQKTTVLKVIKELMQTGESIGKVAKNLGIDRSGIFKHYMPKIKLAALNVLKLEDAPLA